MLIALIFVSLPHARADWINLTGAETALNIAEITVLDDRVSVKLEIYYANLSHFEDLLPDNWINAKTPNRPSLEERLKRFSTETFQIATDDGTSLRPKLKLIEPRTRKDRASPFAGMINPTTRQRVRGAPKDKRVVYVELEYPFAEKPKSLTFIPPQGERGNAAVEMGFIAYHKTVPIIDFRYLSRASKVTLDWVDPWYSKFNNKNLKRHHTSAQMSFLYVEPREVRHEVLIRVRDLEEWSDLGIGDTSMITGEDQAKIKKQATAFFATRNPLKIDGTMVEPISSRAEFLNISLKGLQVVEGKKSLDRSTAIVGIILSYPITHLPKNVTIQWDLFNERVQRIPATVIDPAGPFLSYIETGNPTIKWQNFLHKYQEPKMSAVTINGNRMIGISVLSLLFLTCSVVAAALALGKILFSRRTMGYVSVLCVVAAALLVRVSVIHVANPISDTPDKAISTKIVAGVLNNVNHAFLHKEPLALKNALSLVVAESSLGDVEAELGRAVAVKVVGGGIARVDTIEDLSLQEISPLKGQSGFSTLAEWTAKASAGHWGHAHQRMIRFRALLELIEQNGAWKLTGITVVDAKQQS